MTERLYYADSYIRRFTAMVIEHRMVQNRPAVILDRTGFYATGGGQPCDKGRLNNCEVLDVFPSGEDAAVIHILDAAFSGTQVEGEIDWSRRFDHMQHHTGQHILTQAFVQTADAKTVGFHLSSDSVTIDLDHSQLSESTIGAAEDLANQIVFENRPVKVHFRQLEDQEGVRIRRLPRYLVTDGLRVIEIENFDSTACGGTHVARTGEIGLIKILKTEKRGRKTRVEFRCGIRALHDYREKNRIINQIAAEFNCRIEETTQAVGRLRQETKDQIGALKTAQNQLIDYEARELLAEAARDHGVTIICAAFQEREASEVKSLASRLTESEKTVALLASAGDQAQFCFARSQDLPFHMGQLLKQTLEGLGGRGGGQPNLAMGGGLAADNATVRQALEKAKGDIAL